MLIITIKQGKEKSLLSGDPWIYLSAIEKVEGRPQERGKPGATAVVQSSGGPLLGRGADKTKGPVWGPRWARRVVEAVDHAMMKRRVQAAVARRAPDVRGADPQALVLVIDGEKDGLPGLLVHSYGGTGGYLVCRFNAAGVDAWKVTIVQALIAATGCPNVFERSDELLRKGEGLPVIWRALAGDEPPQRLMVRDGSRLLPTDIRTGFVYPR